jgi:hypothetical protein
MSLFFRSRPPRKFRRESAGKALHKTLVPMPDTGADSMPATLPAPRAAPTPVRRIPRKQKQRVIGYGITGAPSRRVFRVT